MHPSDKVLSRRYGHTLPALASWSSVVVYKCVYINLRTSGLIWSTSPSTFYAPVAAILCLHLIALLLTRPFYDKSINNITRLRSIIILLIAVRQTIIQDVQLFALVLFAGLTYKLHTIWSERLWFGRIKRQHKLTDATLDLIYGLFRYLEVCFKYKTLPLESNYLLKCLFQFQNILKSQNRSEYQLLMN